MTHLLSLVSDPLTIVLLIGAVASGTFALISWRPRK